MQKYINFFMLVFLTYDKISNLLYPIGNQNVISIQTIGVFSGFL